MCIGRPMCRCRRSSLCVTLTSAAVRHQMRTMFRAATRAVTSANKRPSTKATVIRRWWRNGQRIIASGLRDAQQCDRANARDTCKHRALRIWLEQTKSGLKSGQVGKSTRVAFADSPQRSQELHQVAQFPASEFVDQVGRHGGGTAVVLVDVGGGDGHLHTLGGDECHFASGG